MYVSFRYNGAKLTHPREVSAHVDSVKRCELNIKVVSNQMITVILSLKCV